MVYGCIQLTAVLSSLKKWFKNFIFAGWGGQTLPELLYATKYK